MPKKYRAQGPKLENWRELVTAEEWLGCVTKQLKVRSCIELMPLDMSCSFSVSDAQDRDLPLIYCSPIFERMTEYDLRDIKGRNHRFLQDPRGRQAAGVSRKHTDNNAVAKMSSRLNIGRECQVILINFKRNTKKAGSRPWMNCLTMIPISLSDNRTVDFIFALQIDCKVYPQNFMGLGRNGYRMIDYRLPLILHRPLCFDFQEVGQDSVLHQLPGSNGSAIPSSSAPACDWSRFLSENVDDVVLVFSLKGVVISASNSVTTLLGVSAEAIVGRRLASFTHESDVVSMLRDFRDAPVNHPLAYLARLKHADGPYMWVEFAGRARLEDSSRGARHIVLSARPWSLIQLPQSVNLADSPCWLRISTEGMILFATAGATTILGALRSDLIGSNFLDIVDDKSRAACRQLLGAAMHGQHGTLRHSGFQVYSGQKSVSDLISNFYPGSADADFQSFLLVSCSFATGVSDFTATCTAMSTGPESRPSNIACEMMDSKAASCDVSTGSVPSHQLFSALDAKNSTSWQFELHRVRMMNRDLRHQVQTVRAQRARKDRFGECRSLPL